MLISLKLQGHHETKQKTPVDQCWWLHHDADGEDEGDGPQFLLVACLGKKYLKVISATTNKLQSNSKLAAALEKYTSSASCMDVSKNGRHVAVAGIRRKGGFVVTWNSTAGLVKVGLHRFACCYVSSSTARYSEKPAGVLNLPPKISP